MDRVHALSLGVAVFLLCIGQILFKLAAEKLDKTSGICYFVLSLVSWQLMLALAIYGVATFIWVYLLSEVPLSRAFPFNALAFVIVPVLGWWLFDEAIGRDYVIGMVLIGLGLYFIVR
jgi:drug/metabolite transporter (DMT)-like permease